MPDDEEVQSSPPLPPAPDTPAVELPAAVPYAPFGVPPRPPRMPDPPRPRTGQFPRIILDGEEARGFMAEWSQQRQDTRQILLVVTDTVLPMIKSNDDGHRANAADIVGLKTSVADLHAVTVAHGALLVDLEARPLAVRSPRPFTQRAAFVVGAVLIAIGSASGLALAARAILDR